MNQQDIKRVAQGLRELAMQYPRADVSAEMIAVYTRQLSDLPADVVTDAMERCGKSLTFFPSVAEIRKEVATSAIGGLVSAEDAWIEVRREIGRVGVGPGRRGEPSFSTDLIRRAVESVGWYQLGMGKVEEARRDFIFTYRNLCTQATDQIQRGEATSVQLTGVLASGNGETALPEGGN